MKEQIKNCKAKMQKTIDSLDREFKSVKAGRANPNILDRVTFDCYGAQTPVNQMASISVAEARILVVQPYDMSTLNAIEKAIQKADIGINPTNDGKVIRVIFPELTEERRKDLTKEVKKKGEEAKVAVRNIRRDAVDSLKKSQKANEITEDDLDTLEIKEGVLCQLPEDAIVCEK